MMKTLWEKEYNLRASDFDKFNQIKPSAVLDLFQDAAGQHALDLGLGFEDMLKRSYLWVLTKIRFKILFQPKSYQKVIIKTWPLKPGKLTYRREYSIEDENGNILIAGSSEWVIIDSEKRRLVAVVDLYPFNDGFNTEMIYEEKLGKIKDFEVTGGGYAVNAGFSQLDVNNHVNNTKYANYVLDAINPDVPNELKEFQIDYRKEVFEGTKLFVHYEKQDSAIVAKGQNSNNEIMFACKLEYKN